MTLLKDCFYPNESHYYPVLSLLYLYLHVFVTTVWRMHNCQQCSMTEFSYLHGSKWLPVQTPCQKLSRYQLVYIDLHITKGYLQYSI